MMSSLLFGTMFLVWLPGVLNTLDWSSGISIGGGFFHCLAACVLFLMIVPYLCIAKVSVKCFSGIILFLLVGAFYNENYFFILFLYLMALLYQPLGLKTFFWHYLFFFAVVVIVVPLLSWCGLLVDDVKNLEKSSSVLLYAHSLGFKNTNNYSMYVYNIACVLYILMNKRKILYYLIVFFFMAIACEVTKARTFSYAAFILPLFELIPIKVRAFFIKHWFCFLLAYFAVSIVTPLMFHTTKLNELLSFRLYYQNLALNSFPLSDYLFGMSSAQYDFFLNNKGGLKLIIDSSVLNLLFTRGVWFLLFILYFSRRIVNRYKDILIAYFPLICFAFLPGLFEARLFDSFFYYLFMMTIPYVAMSKMIVHNCLPRDEGIAFQVLSQRKKYFN